MAPYALNSCPNLFTVYKVLPSGHSVSLIFPQFQREIPNMKLLITLFLAAATILTGSQGQQCVEDDCLGKLCDTDADCATCPGRTAWAMRSSFFNDNKKEMDLLPMHQYVIFSQIVASAGAYWRKDTECASRPFVPASLVLITPTARAQRGQCEYRPSWQIMY